MKKILLISDDRELLAKLHEVLRGYEIELIVLPGHENTLNNLLLLKPDLILIDFLLQNANGGALCHQIRGLKELMHLPVILFTEQAGIERFGSKFGSDFILHKSSLVADMAEALLALAENPNLAPHAMQ